MPTGDLQPDALTRYIYRHYAALLTPREKAAERYRIFRAQSMAAKDPNNAHTRTFWIGAIERDFPDLVDQLEREGVSAFMDAARDRVMREHAKQIQLNTCPACGQLCRTPRARQCLECGHDWHTETAS